MVCKRDDMCQGVAQGAIVGHSRCGSCVVGVRYRPSRIERYGELLLTPDTYCFLLLYFISIESRRRWRVGGRRDGTKRLRTIQEISASGGSFQNERGAVWPQRFFRHAEMHEGGQSASSGVDIARLRRPSRWGGLTRGITQRR